MAAFFPEASEVARLFVTKYYQIIQQSPQLAHQFYSDASSVVRIEGATEYTAVSTMDIHSILSSLNFTSIEIKTLHSLPSWNRGVLVMVSGIMQMEEYNGRREFVQTFFLAPQDKGYFVYSDIFHLLDEESRMQPSSSILGHNNYESFSNLANHHMQDSVLGYTAERENQIEGYGHSVMVFNEESRDYVGPAHADEIDPIDKYSIPEPQYSISEPRYSIPEPQQASEIGDQLNGIPVEDFVASFQSAVSIMQDAPTSLGEPSVEQPKKTYASILRFAKGQPGNSMPRVAPVSKFTSTISDAQLAVPQQSYPVTSSVVPETSRSEAVEDVTAADDEGEVTSVYLGNLSSSVSASDLEHVFKNFGRIKPNGVTVRSRKDSGGYYAFVEFEDAASIQIALQASPVTVNGRQIYVEERRPNSGISRMGGRRGRGRGGYPTEASRGRFGGRGYSRSGGNDNDDREYSSNRPKGNGVLQRVPRQERGILGNHGTRNAQNPSEAAY